MLGDDDRQAAQRALAQPSCGQCGVTITNHQAVHPGHCGAARCATSHAVGGFRSREDQRAEEYVTRQNDARAKIGHHLTQVSEVLGRDVEDVLLAVVPFQDERVEPLSEDVRTRFEAHVTRIVTEAYEAGPEDINMMNYASGVAKEPSIIAAGCTACQGSCCRRGGGDNHAFLTRQTVYHMRNQDPDLEPEAVIQHYMDALPDASVHGACVFQSVVGCTLGRAWRSSVCNVFLCHDIHNMHTLTGGRTDVPLAIVGVEEGEPGRVIAFDANRGATKIK